MGVWEPVYQAASGVIITNESGEVLMVASPYRPDLVLPGGIVEPNESPAATAEREVREETGLIVRVSRLLVVEHLPAGTDRPSALRFVFDGPSVSGNTVLHAQDDEVSQLLWLPQAEAVARHAGRGRRRLALALQARAHDSGLYLDDRGVLPESASRSE